MYAYEHAQIPSRTWTLFAELVLNSIIEPMTTDTCNTRLCDNRATVISFAREVKEKFPDKDIWLFSGYTLEEIEADDNMRDILKYIDVLVDGPFIEELKDRSLAFRGSSNQRIVHVSQRLQDESEGQ